MRAVVLPSFHAPLELEECPVPAPRGDGDVVVKVLACGVCHSDLHVVDGYFSSPLPLVLGHEIAGELESGERVLVYTPWGCGECRFCLATEEMICPDGKEAGMFQDGGYAEYVRVPARRYIYPIGDLDPVQAAPLGCGGLTPYRAVKPARPWLGLGSDDSLANAARLVDRKGVAIVMGLFGGRIPFGLGAVPHEARFMSSIWGSRDELAGLVALAQRERLEYTVETMPLEQAQDAHGRLRRGEA